MAALEVKSVGKNLPETPVSCAYAIKAGPWTRHHRLPAEPQRAPLTPSGLLREGWFSRRSSSAPAAATASCSAIRSAARATCCRTLPIFWCPSCSDAARLRTAYTGRTLRENLAT